MNGGRAAEDGGEEEPPNVLTGRVAPCSAVMERHRAQSPFSGVKESAP